ncbi:MAG: radical SAM protein [Candidatus Thermoplasmatota archaeon]|nr:radical SAM protein [Candidatus Thermoplasmatota archaeon]
MREITSWLHESTYIEPLSPGCRMCARGSKLVLLITGICPASCYYCPLSFKKGGKDVIYADEWKLKNQDDVKTLLKEATYIKAEGAGITGGDPLSKWERTIRYITLLKNEYGASFHIHLYTSGLHHAEAIPDIVAAGLDEIRFHPPPHYWSDMAVSPLAKTIARSLDTTADVAIEIPSIPSWQKQIISLIDWSERQGIKWINLNELEFSERNSLALEERGFQVKDDISAAVLGSQETAIAVLQHIALTDYMIGVHYCSSSFKDGIQLTNRIKRRARSIARETDIITDEGTILKGIIQPMHGTTLFDLSELLQHKYHLSKKTFYLNRKQKRIELHLDILEKIAKDITKKGHQCFIIEEYPTADKLEVERIPLP